MFPLGMPLKTSVIGFLPSLSDVCELANLLSIKKYSPLSHMRLIYLEASDEGPNQMLFWNPGILYRWDAHPQWI